jgi:hypothetical protein
MEYNLPRQIPVRASGSNLQTESLEELNASNHEPADVNLISLPRADGGKDAWMFLASCFVLEMIIWGFPFTFGVFQDYYSQHPPFQGQANIPVIGTCTMVSRYQHISKQIFQRKYVPNQRHRDYGL